MNQYFLSPHADDISLSVGGILLKGIVKGPRNLVSVFTKGLYLKYFDHKKRYLVEEATAIRESEDVLYCDQISATYNSINLKDATLRKYDDFDSIFTQKSSTCDPYYQSVEGALQKFILQLDEPFTLWCPLGIGNHIDHILLRDVIREIPIPEENIIYYEDLPYAADYDQSELNSFCKTTIKGYTSLIVDITKVFEKKLSLLKLYKSQVSLTEINKVMFYSSRLSRHQGYYERLWISNKQVQNEDFYNR